MPKTTTKKTEEKKVEGKHTVLSGVVMKTAMQKTIVVKVTRFEKHPKYKKYQTSSKKYKVHDEDGVAKVGDKVDIVETRPISKDKHFKLLG
jgi:small subunit ribosomal protein S17